MTEPDAGRESHVDVLGLLTGELSPSARGPALAHARACAACRDELVVGAAALGEVRDATRHAPVDPSEVPPLRLDRSGGPSGEVRTTRVSAPTRRASRSPGRPRRTAAALAMAAVAAAVLVGSGVGVGLGIGSLGDADGSGVTSTGSPAAPVALVSVGGPGRAAGVASMTGHDGGQQMHVVLVGLPPPGPGRHYTIWLVDTRHDRARSVGVMPTGGPAVMRAAFALPEEQAAGYDVVDVSQESDSFAAIAPSHSLLRGSLV